MTAYNCYVKPQKNSGGFAPGPPTIAPWTPDRIPVGSRPEAAFRPKSSRLEQALLTERVTQLIESFAGA